MKIVNGPDDVPEGHHYAIIIFKTDSVYIPGDERSRTNPGHGYPARTETFHTTEYSVTHNHAEWVKEIRRLEKDKGMSSYLPTHPYVALEVASKASVEIEVVIK
jgi:hypothetical protein